MTNISVTVDIMLVVRDVVDGMADQRLARFVVDNHIRSHPNFLEDVDES